MELRSMISTWNNHEKKLENEREIAEEGPCCSACLFPGNSSLDLILPVTKK
jgi:hypothetical protein